MKHVIREMLGRPDPASFTPEPGGSGEYGTWHPQDVDVATAHAVTDRMLDETGGEHNEYTALLPHVRFRQATPFVIQGTHARTHVGDVGNMDLGYRFVVTNPEDPASERVTRRGEPVISLQLNGFFTNIHHDALYAPVDRRALWSVIANLPTREMRLNWARAARDLGWHHPGTGPERLARYKAPAGGAVVNNTGVKGGQFMSKPMKRIRDVGAALAKLARLGDRPYMPGSPVTGQEIAASESAKSSMTLRELKEIEDAHDLHPDDRLSSYATPTGDGDGDNSTFTAHKEHVARYFDALHAKRADEKKLVRLLKDARMGPDARVAALVSSQMGHEAREYFDLSKSSGPEWYGKDLDKFETAAHELFGAKPGSTDMTLLKALIALSSGSQDPPRNAGSLYRMFRAGQRNNPKNPVLGIPPVDTDRLKGWLAAVGNVPTRIPNPSRHGSAPEAEVAYWIKHVHDRGFADVHHGYSTNKARVVVKPGHPDHGKIVSWVEGDDWRETPDAAALRKRHGPDARVIDYPLFDRKTGELKPVGWGTRGERIAGGLKSLQTLVEQYGNEGAAEWLLTEHSPQEFIKVFGRAPKPSLSGVASGEKLPGSFIFGPKFGAFFLNLHANHPEHRDKSKWLTADMWWTRSFHRMLGTLMRAGGKIVGAPGSVKERKTMRDVAERAAGLAGLNSVAQLQAVMWTLEQALWRMHGVGQAKTYSFADAVPHIKALKEADDARLRS